MHLDRAFTTITMFIAGLTVICLSLTGCVSNLYSLDGRVTGFRDFAEGSEVSYEADANWYYIEGSDTPHGEKRVQFWKYRGENPPTNATSVQLKKYYRIDRDKLVEDYNANFVQGFNFAGLVVPFKYRLGSESTLSPSSSLGGSLGYTYSLGINVRVTGSAFAGLSAIPLNNINSQKVDNKFGLSYGVGLIFDISKRFQLGAVYGWDNLPDTKDWQYNGKPWISFGIGYKFLNM